MLILKNIVIDLLKESLYAEEINKKRASVIKELKQIIKTEVTVKNFNELMTPKVLKELFILYDKYFFDNEMIKMIEKNDCIITVCFDNRCTKTAGKCSYNVD